MVLWNFVVDTSMDSRDMEFYFASGVDVEGLVQSAMLNVEGSEGLFYSDDEVRALLPLAWKFQLDDVKRELQVSFPQLAHMTLQDILAAQK